ncbi:acid protease [Dentipellis sp. KUC8613]|nr:acid protease [Dentipellis sp. KUC8613]
MKGSLFAAGLVAAGGILGVAALQIPVVQRRAEKKGSSRFSLLDGGDLLYMGNVTLGGEDFLVQMDTGSSDLWVVSEKPISNLNTTDIFVNITYGLGFTAGNISFAPMEFASHKVPKQAFIFNGIVDQGTLDSYAKFGAQGLIGLGFDTIFSSNILTAVANRTHGDVSGKAPLGNIFEQDPSTPNTLSFLFSRADDLESSATGMFAIGEEVQGYENVTKTPKLERTFAGPSSVWGVLLDEFVVNGHSAPLASTLNDSAIPKGKVVTLLDSGSSAAQISIEAAKLIYDNIPGAVFSPADAQWVIPCNASSNVTLTFGGQKFPIHPLDLSQLTENQLPSGKNVTICVSNWSPSSGDTRFDFLLGDAFLRNAYTSFNYGNISLADEDISNPFVHMLPLTNAETAWPDFIKSRQETLKRHAPEATLDEIHQIVNASNAGASSSDSDDSATASPLTSTSTPRPAGTSASTSRSAASTSNAKAYNKDEDVPTRKLASALSDSGSSNDITPLLERLDKYGPAVLGLLAGNIIVGVALCILGFTLCRRRDRRTINPSYAPVRETVAPNESFVDLNKYQD